MAFAPGPIALARLRALLGQSAWVELSARGGVLFAAFDGSLGQLWTVRVGAGAGLDF